MKCDGGLIEPFLCSSRRPPSSSCDAAFTVRRTPSVEALLAAHLVRDGATHSSASSTTTSSSPFASSCLARHSIADWILTIVIWVVGMHLDHAPPFERDIRPQLHDPDISYPHTTGPQQQIPAWLLWRLAVPLPLILLVPLALFPPKCTVAAAARRVVARAAHVGRRCIIPRLPREESRRPFTSRFFARCLPDANGVCTGDAKTIHEAENPFQAATARWASASSTSRSAPTCASRQFRRRGSDASGRWCCPRCRGSSRRTLRSQGSRIIGITGRTFSWARCSATFARSSYRLRRARRPRTHIGVAQEEQSLLKVRSPPAEPCDEGKRCSLRRDRCRPRADVGVHAVLQVTTLKARASISSPPPLDEAARAFKDSMAGRVDEARQIRRKVGRFENKELLPVREAAARAARSRQAHGVLPRLFAASSGGRICSRRRSCSPMRRRSARAPDRLPRDAARVAGALRTA